MQPKNNKNKIVDQLKSLAGEVIYIRGVDYFNDKKITNLSVEKLENSNRHLFVSGEISGEDIYIANFYFDLKKNIFLDSQCDCPYVGFCKHRVALGLCFLDKNLDKQVGQEDFEG